MSVLCLDDENIRDILHQIRKRRTTYGLSPEADYRATDVTQQDFVTRFRAHHCEDGDLGEFALPIPGRHMVQNALAVIAVARELEVPLDIVAESLAGFTGVRRRFQRIGEVDDVLLIDDYGHHPTEIKATLAAARAGFGRRLVVAFQPQSVHADPRFVR